MYVVHTITLAERLGVGPEGGQGTPDFGKSVNPIYSNQRAHYAHHITNPPPLLLRFSDLPPALWPSDWASDRRGLFNTANACTCILHCSKFSLGKEP